MGKAVSVGSMVVIVLGLVLASCSSDDNESSNPAKSSVNLGSLAGTWDGDVRFVRRGDCQINGEDTLFIANTRMYWQVGAEGTVTIGEDFFYSQWTGKVYPALGIELIKVNDWTRGDGPSAVCVDYDTTEYIGQIISTPNGGFELRLSSVENWCANDTCRFAVEYNLTKRQSATAGWPIQEGESTSLFWSR